MTMDNTISYAQKLEIIRNKLMENEHLNKVQSIKILNEYCPYCEFSNECVYTTEDSNFKLCKLLSSELTRVWLLVTPDRSKIEAGKTYGKITVNYLKYINNYGNKFWECERDGKIVIMQGSHILRDGRVMDGINPVIVNKKWRYTVGSHYNPDGSTHVFATEHYSKQGRAIETVETIMITDTESADFGETFHYEARRPCPCGGTLRYDDHGEAQCDRCEGTTILK